eukprot:gene3246-14793_t
MMVADNPMLKDGGIAPLERKLNALRQGGSRGGSRDLVNALAYSREVTMAAAVEQIQESAPGSGPAVGYPSSYMEDDNGDDDDDNEDFEDHSSESSVSRCSSVESLEGKREVEADDVANDDGSWWSCCCCFDSKRKKKRREFRRETRKKIEAAYFGPQIGERTPLLLPDN